MKNQIPVDVLLTYPSDSLRLFQSMIPIGLVSIGTVLQNAGYSVKIIDFNHYNNDFRKDLSILQPRIIGIGGTTSSRAGSFLTARIAKQVLPRVPIVYGGVHATFTAQETLNAILHIDFILKGEGELPFLKLCDFFLKGRTFNLYDIPGLCWRCGNIIKQNSPERLQDLSLLPIADRRLLGNDYPMDMEFIGCKGDFIMTSRGCPAACNFCSASSMFPGGVRTRPMDSVMSEVEQLLNQKSIQGLKLFDSTFTAKREHVHNFCSEIAKFKIPWECEIRADTVDEDLLKLMKASGCYYVNIGMETANEQHLKHISKGISPTQVLNTLSFCKKLDIRSKVFFTFGHIGQTFKECLQDVKFIEDNKTSIDFFAVTIGMRIYPGTRLETECERSGLFKRIIWAKSAKSVRNLFVFEPSDIPIAFQKQLGPLKLFLILIYLLYKRLICNEHFLLKMATENALGLMKSVKLQFAFTRHRTLRLIEKLGAGSF